MGKLCNNFPEAAVGNEGGGRRVNNLKGNELPVHTGVHECKSCISTEMNGLKDSSVVKSTHCSSTEPEFSSQHPLRMPHNCLELLCKEDLSACTHTPHPKHTHN